MPPSLLGEYINKCKELHNGIPLTIVYLWINFRKLNKKIKNGVAKLHTHLYIQQISIVKKPKSKFVTNLYIVKK